MNTTQISQLKHDNRKQPPVSDSPQDTARAEWLYNAEEELLRSTGVSFQRRMNKPQGVTADQFALAVDEYVNNRLANCEIETPALGRLLISGARGNVDKSDVAELLGNSDHPLGKLGEIAEALLEPLVDDALIAQSEDNEL